MTQEEKQLLLQDLCARLPYVVVVAYKNQENKESRVELGYGNIGYVVKLGRGWWTVCKPYLRPMSSMTEEERKEYCQLADSRVFNIFVNPRHELIDWLNAHHFDYRGLIEKGLAIEAPANMYNTK